MQKPINIVFVFFLNKITILGEVAASLHVLILRALTESDSPEPAEDSRPGPKKFLLPGEEKIEQMFVRQVPQNHGWHHWLLFYTVCLCSWVSLKHNILQNGYNLQSIAGKVW